MTSPVEQSIIIFYFYFVEQGIKLHNKQLCSVCFIECASKSESGNSKTGSFKVVLTVLFSMKEMVAEIGKGQLILSLFRDSFNIDSTLNNNCFIFSSLVVIYGRHLK